MNRPQATANAPSLDRLTGEFSDPDLELRFVRAMEPAYIRRFRAGWILSAAVTVGLAYNDIQWGGSPVESLGVRVVGVAPGLTLASLCGRLGAVATRRLQPLVVVWGVACLAGLVMVSPRFYEGVGIWSVFIIAGLMAWNGTSWRGFVVMYLALLALTYATPHLTVHSIPTFIQTRHQNAVIGAGLTAAVFVRSRNREARERQYALWSNEELLRARERLIGTIAHELRTAIARCEMSLELAKGELGGGPAGATRLLVLERSLGNLNALVDATLRFGTLDASGWGIEVSGFGAERLSDAAREAHEVASETASLELAPFPDEIFFGDEVLLASAVSNLVRNAARFAREQIRVALELRDDLALLTVDDDGPGVPEGEREIIFAPFVRGERGRAGGFGLGLALTRLVAEKHDGGVTVSESDLGGARFSMTFRRDLG